MDKPFRQNASIIAKKDGKFLLVRKPRNHHAWQFPQGGVEKGENFEQAALREFTEEIGCSKLENLKEVGVYNYNWPENIEIEKRLKKFRGQEVHLFLADFTGIDSEIKLEKKELAEWCWIDVNNLEKLIESPVYLTKVLEIINAAK
ncbi:NUDIX domain-containing protein [Candidatus Gracilibacteria bacterium]|nr:NUDIX domain-containing protein [Candidatus Gracilibacteria bacterium]MCF7856698.1 NUDIX domain-containing protein [Candidatus Gracilibacteria bacterium]MCF7896978.1 NUDIX domain-containing protein [Candidatus Gracilibacteria bacterium]